MKYSDISLSVNGFTNSYHVPVHYTLLQTLREVLGLTGTKNGCSAGECGACTVLIDGEPVNSCMVLAIECEGAEIVTIEGLSAGGPLSAMQEALIDKNGVQCGFCTPGVILTAHALLEHNPNPSEQEIKEALVGNLCRCTGYSSIVAAVQLAAERLQSNTQP